MCQLIYIYLLKYLLKNIKSNFFQVTYLTVYFKLSKDKFYFSELARWFGLKATTTMTLQWLLLLALVTTLIAAEKVYDENGNDLLRWLDNSGRGFGTWRSPPEEEDEELEYSGNIFKNG